MHAFALFLVWLPVAIGFYAYIGYPLLLWIGAKARPHRVKELPPVWPMVSIVIPAYNEEAQIAGAVEALLAQDYPADRRQILVLSDASTDRTDDIVRGYAAQGVELLRMPVRGGKTAAENASCALIRGEIVVNSDSSIRLQPSTVRLLVQEMMLDPTVGVASGRDVSVAAVAADANATEAGYVGYEMWVRDLETATGGIVGASGSGYAIRTSLHKIPIREDLSRDFSAALTARTHGYRAVSVSRALCLVPRTSSLRREYRRKVRTINRGIATLIFQRHLLNPFRYGAFAWKLCSHKICRWLLPASAIPGAIGLAILAVTEPWARVVLAAAMLVSALGALALLFPEGKPLPRFISIPAFGLSANIAVVNAIWRAGRGPHDHIWEPTRREPTPLATDIPVGRG